MHPDKASDPDKELMRLHPSSQRAGSALRFTEFQWAQSTGKLFTIAPHQAIKDCTSTEHFVPQDLSCRAESHLSERLVLEQWDAGIFIPIQAP